MNPVRYISSLLIFLSVIPAKASDPKLKVSSVEESQKSILQATKPVGPNSVPVPRFALMNKEKNFIMALGGFIEPIIGMDIGNTLNGNMYFSPSAIVNIPPVTGQKADFFINPLNSAIDLQVIGFAHTKKQITGYVKFDFSGGNDSKFASLSSVYIKFRNFLAGYNHSLFTDLYSLPKTISWSGVTGNSWSKSYQISYNSPSYKGFSYGISIEQPSFNSDNYKYEGKDYPEYDNDEVIGKATQPVPDIPFYIQYKWKERNHVRLSGVIRNFNYVDKRNDRVEHTIGAGVQLSAALQPVKPLTVYLQGIYGKGIGHYISGMQYLSVSFLPENQKPGKMEATRMLGCISGLKYDLTNDLSLNASFGYSSVFDVNTIYWDKYKYGLDGRFSLFYNLTSFIQTGVEYLWAKQVQYDHKQGAVNRIQAMVMFYL